MATEPEAAPGALATRPASEMAASKIALTGGAGLFDHSARDAVRPGAGHVAGILGLLTLVLAAALAVVIDLARRRP